MPLTAGNVTISKVASHLQLAGADPTGAVLAGLSGRITLTLDRDETITSLDVTAPDAPGSAFSQSLSWTPANAGGVNPTVYADIVFGTDTATGSTPVRNFVDWTTSRGSGRRQFYVVNLPASGSLYVCNQEAQSGEAVVYAEIGGTGYAPYVSLALNILPDLNDELFRQHEYTGNRYANTRRAWGGAETAAVFIDDVLVISERAIETIHNYYWLPTAYGLHDITVRLRATSGSTSYVDIDGHIRVRQIPCG